MCDGTYGTNKTYMTYDIPSPMSCETYRELCETRPAEIIANRALCLIHQTNHLLDRQIRRLEQDFIEEGGLRERMTRVRLQQRNKTG